MSPSELLRKYPIISDQVERQELLVILSELERLVARGIPGSILEFGCYSGTTSLFIRRLIQDSREFHVYDSFEGLPEKTVKDLSPAGLQFKPGELSASKNDFVMNFKKAGLALPNIHKCWFKHLTPADIPKPVAFAFLDGDYYASVLYPLRLVWDYMTHGGVIIVDDYQNEALPGASKAVDEWLRSHSVATFRVEASLAVMVLPPR